MSKANRFGSKSALLGLVVVLLAAGCDRLDRVGTLFGASKDQIANPPPAETPVVVSLSSLSPEERAIAGQIMAVSNLEDYASPTSYFAVGSVIAKPLDEYIEELEVEAPPEAPLEEVGADGAAVPGSPEAGDTGIGGGGELESTGDLSPTAPETAPTKVEGLVQPENNRVAAPPASAPPRLMRPAPPPPVAAIEAPPPPRMMIRRMVREPARTRAEDALSQLGLTGVLQTGPSGEVIIRMGEDGAAPTAFPTQVDQAPNARPIFAAVGEAACPEGVTPQALQADPVTATACVVKILRESGEFAYVEPDFIVTHQMERRRPTVTVGAYVPPNDPLLSMQWHYRTNGSDRASGQSLGGAGFVDYWSRTRKTGSRDVVVAVIDTGLQMAHPDMANSPNIGRGFDMVSDVMMGNDGDGRDDDPNDPGDKCDPASTVQTDTFHGTHVAGTVGAALTNNGTGVAGGAWNVTVVPVRALGRCGGRLSDINDAIRWAAGISPGLTSDGREVWTAKRADIINMSLGLFERCPASMQSAIDDAVAAGSIVVAAAGNARLSTAWYAPAGCRNVVTVAAGDARGQITPYSNYGAEVDILAPGGDVTRDDDGDGRPDGVLSTKQATNCIDPVTGQLIGTCNYAYENGTSMAAPHVAAALALLKAEQPTATPDQLVSRLLGAIRPRTQEQCAGECRFYPGTSPYPGAPTGMCARPCGAGLLDLSIAAASTGSPATGSR